MIIENFLVYLLVMPLLGCLSILLGGKPSTAARTVTLLGLLGSFYVFSQFQLGIDKVQFETLIPWLNLPTFFKLTFHLGVDGLNLPLLMLTSIVAFAAVWISPADVKRAKEYYISLLLIILGCLGAFISYDLFFMFVFHEIALIPTFIMVGVWGDENRKEAATRMTIYLMAGSMVLLAGLLALYFSLPVGARTFDLIAIKDILHHQPLAELVQGKIFILLLIGFGVLVSLFPFHNWAPAGYASAPESTAMLHAGVLKKFGLYGLIRVAIPFLPEGMEIFSDLFLVLLVCNILYIGWVTLAQKDLKQMLGYSSVMHMGLIFLGLLSLNVISVSGAIFLMAAHGLAAALIFALSGEVIKRSGTRVMANIGGLARKCPSLTLFFVIAALTSGSLIPGVGTFAAEIMIFFGAWKEYPIATLLALWGVVLSAVYLLRAIRHIFYGESKISLDHVNDLSGWKEKLPYVFLMICLFAIGLMPGILLNIVEPAVTRLLGGQ